ncbi:MAG: hypothetical protein HKM24_02305, partial [Gammaproteobacteria bacterium]|nr:hypothetical protein [Gammaproteobacteria bacterium]
MTWLSAAFISQLLSLGGNYTDKYFLETKVPDHTAAMIMATMFDLAIAAPLFVFAGMPFLGWWHSFLATLTGIFMAVSLLPYYWMTKRYPVSLNEFFFKFDFLILMVIGYFWFDEHLTSVEIGAAFLIMIGALVFTRAKPQAVDGNRHIDALYFLMVFLMLTRIIFGAAMSKYLLQFHSAIEILIYFLFGLTLTGWVIFAGSKNLRQKTIAAISDQALQK